MSNFDVEVKQLFDLEQVKANVNLAFNREVMKQVSENPTVRILNLDELSIDDYKEYIASFHATLWSHFSVGSPDSLEQAAKWLQNQFNQFHRHYSDIQVGETRTV